MVKGMAQSPRRRLLLSLPRMSTVRLLRLAQQRLGACHRLLQRVANQPRAAHAQLLPRRTQVDVGAPPRLPAIVRRRAASDRVPQPLGGALQHGGVGRAGRGGGSRQRGGGAGGLVDRREPKPTRPGLDVGAAQPHQRLAAPPHVRLPSGAEACALQHHQQRRLRLEPGLARRGRLGLRPQKPAVSLPGAPRQKPVARLEKVERDCCPRCKATFGSSHDKEWIGPAVRRRHLLQRGGGVGSPRLQLIRRYCLLDLCGKPLVEGVCLWVEANFRAALRTGAAIGREPRGLE
mmetsp:Transcript_24344/g.79598  ORF Transcript_24344/g.79598 Transcript_24344/m.79598 type:complete len:290 (+) Transcript_24344:328-1197(+)